MFSAHACQSRNSPRRRRYKHSKKKKEDKRKFQEIFMTLQAGFRRQVVLQHVVAVIPLLRFQRAISIV